MVQVLNPTKVRDRSLKTRKAISTWEPEVGGSRGQGGPQVFMVFQVSRVTHCLIKQKETKVDIGTHTCNSSPWEVGARNSGVQSPPRLYSELRK